MRATPLTLHYAPQPKARQSAIGRNSLALRLTHEVIMSSSFTVTESTSFTVVHVRWLASKIATDLLRLQRFYGKPTDQQINDYESEITALLRDDYVSQVTYGLKRNGSWVE